jgi:hypothetical protein
VVEVGPVNNKVEKNNSMKRGPSGKQTRYHYLTDNSIMCSVSLESYHPSGLSRGRFRMDGRTDGQTIERWPRGRS